jgi:hypothetical protein
MIKNKLIILFLIILFLFTSACTRSTRKDIESNQDEGITVDIKEEAPSFQPLPLKKYLYVNGIEIEPRTHAEELPNHRIHVDTPEIKGLLDKKVQDKLNKAFWQEAQNFIAKPLPVFDTKPLGLKTPEFKTEKWYSYSVNANYNNVLSLVIYSNEVYGPDLYTDKMIPYLYELKSGNKLGIEDLFIEGADGIKMINERISNYILKNHLEEEMLTKPFQGIKKDQPFYLSDSTLTIVLDKRNSEFVYPNQHISISFDELKGAIDIYHKYSDNTNSIYEKEKLAKKMLPNPIKIKYSFIYR